MISDIIQPSFRINLRLLSVLRMYPPENCSRMYRIQAHLIHFLFISLVPVLCVLYLLLEDDLDMERVNYNAGFIAQATCFILKLLPFVTNGERIRKCIDYFNTYAFTEVRNSQKHILTKCVYICRRNSKIFLVSVAGGLAGWALKPMVLEQRYLPVDIWLPFTVTEDLYVYCVVYVLVVIGISISGLATGVIDPLIAGLAYHATSQVEILNDNLQHLDKYVEEDITTGPETRDDIIYMRITRSVKHHNAILNFVNEYEVCFSWVMFTQIAASVFVLCFSCLQLSKIESLDFNFLQLTAYFAVILGQIYFYCYYGSTLSQESDAITKAIYMSKWYKYDTRCKKALILLMERAKDPLVVTAGKLVDLSLITFATILRRSYSLLAVLKNYQ